VCCEEIALARRKRKTTTFNSKSFNKNLNDKVENAFTRLGTTMAKEAAFNAVDSSPVWSGAYVRSFSIVANSRNRKGRSFSSPDDWRNSRLSGSEVTAVRQRVKQQLLGDINVIKSHASDEGVSLKSITVRNDAPHALLVKDTAGIFSGARRAGIGRRG
jgi:hypothetical protein